MARASLIAAQSLAIQSEEHSRVSRAYDAAYQAVTALLRYARQQPPEGREARSHEATPHVLESLPLKILGSQTQRDLTERLQALYELSLSADHRGNAQLGGSITAATRSAAFILILSGE